MTTPRSCDTFVVLPPVTANGCVVFGKNSDRPLTEVQEVVYYPAKDHDSGSKLQCTYIEIEEVNHTYSVILSKPAWMWGAEMGANEHGVCIGNEAVWNKLNSSDDLTEKLLGMDLLRLGLERSKTARESVDVITSLLKQYGQGGNCEEALTQWSYHNSFIMADQKEAWVLETVGNHWAAEHITEGVRNISNEYSITTKMDLTSDGLIEMATEKDLYSSSQGEFNFAQVFSGSGGISNQSTRYRHGLRMLKDLSKSGEFGVKDMMSILRDEDSGICMTGGFTSMGSQVSAISPAASSFPSCHWFTATPNPSRSFYKPFLFGPGVKIGDATKSPEYGDQDPAKLIPRFKSTVDRRHPLFKGHEKFSSLLDKDDPKSLMILENIKELENNCVADMEEVLSNFGENSFYKISEIFSHMSNLELNFYK
ncbi:hypothetical protein SNE40_022898 [Patella caerulea]|uniref:Secernin-3 n=1 Tax=Patella caerulea TaxID=87958 RepID=A0AAN8GG19_PATCE